MKEAPMELAKNAAERASRGEVIITQKEAKGEYGTNWLWNGEVTTLHVFDNTNMSGVPARMTNYGTGYSNTNYSNSYYCIDDYTITSGDILAGMNQYAAQVSCNPNTNNVGNYYAWNTAMAINPLEDVGTNTAGYVAPNSICPKNWRAPSMIIPGAEKNYSFSDVAELYTGITSQSGLATSYEEKLRKSPFSSIRAGHYRYNSQGIDNRSQYGRYWINQTSLTSLTNFGYVFNSEASVINAEDLRHKSFGVSVRCVAR